MEHDASNQFFYIARCSFRSNMEIQTYAIALINALFLKAPEDRRQVSALRPQHRVLSWRKGHKIDKHNKNTNNIPSLHYTKKSHPYTRDSYLFIVDTFLFGVRELQILPQPANVCSSSSVIKANLTNRRLSASCHVVNCVCQSSL